MIMSWGLFAHSSKIKLLFSPVNSKQAAANHQLSAPKNQPPTPSVKQSVPQWQPQSNNTETTASFSGNSTSPGERRLAAFGLRVESALFQKCLPLPGHPSNNDELIYPTKIGNYTKALPHNQHGEVNATAYQAYLEALITGDPEAFDVISLGGTARLTNPQAAYAYEMVGPDSHHLSIPLAPSFDSAWEAGEMVELYWQALAKDIPFQQYATDTLIEEAAAELTGVSDFRGPKENAAVTPNTLFRINLPGALEGPYISQFLYRDIPYGAAALPQRYNSPLPKQSFLTDYSAWLNVQNGLPPVGKINYSGTPGYLRNGRDLSEYVHSDFSFQAPLTACLILLNLGQSVLSDTNPYLCSSTQTGFATFGAPHILDFVVRASRAALEAAWYQKWLVHRRLRPEEFGGAIHNQLTGAADYSISAEVLNSKALCQVFGKYGTYLLPQSYPEGSPTHPAYPAGHAALIGAGVTILKAFFKESSTLPNPVMTSPDGLSLVSYSGAPLTIGGELNKLAANIGMGRDFAGIHWRSDNDAGLALGEAVAIGILQDYHNTYNEDFAGFSFTKFDGNTVMI